MFIQIQSFEANLAVPELASKEGGPETFRGVFIRAPAILEVGPDVQVLADYPVPFKSSLGSDSSVEHQKVCGFLVCPQEVFSLQCFGCQSLSVSNRWKLKLPFINTGFALILHYWDSIVYFNTK